MTIRDLLQKCRDEKREIIILTEKRDELRASLLPRAIRPTASQVQMSKENVFDRVQASIFDLNMQIERQLEELYRNESLAFYAVSGLSESRHRQMLILYYLTFRVHRGVRRLHTWESVAFEMGYSMESIKKMRSDLQEWLSLPAK